MSAIRAALSRQVTSALTSPRLRQWRRTWAAMQRRLANRVPEVHYFHQVDDPYSHLAATQLQAFSERYAVKVSVYLVPAPEASAAPEIERLREWSARDAQRLALCMGIAAPDFAPKASPADLAAAQQAIANAITTTDIYTRLQTLSLQFWIGAAIPPGAADTSAAVAMEQGKALRDHWGHYLGATFYFEGEWYWGVDRLHYLEQRLVDAGLGRQPTTAANTTWTPLLAPRKLRLPALLSGPTAPATPSRPSSRPVLHFYCSLRSPYTYLAARQVRLLAEHYGADLRIRFVLPMVMRGLPVPLSKRLYIVRDAKREAERLGVPFGCVVDPVGTPTERGLALLHRAIALGKGSALVESFLQGVFADGIDAGSDSGLVHIAQRAGLTATDVDAALADSGWRDVAEGNRADLFARGIWGVPAFRIDDQPVLWGQDRLWMLEDDLIKAQAQREGIC